MLALLVCSCASTSLSEIRKTEETTPPSVKGVDIKLGGTFSTPEADPGGFIDEKEDLEVVVPVLTSEERYDSLSRLRRSQRRSAGRITMTNDSLGNQVLVCPLDKCGNWDKLISELEDNSSSLKLLRYKVKGVEASLTMRSEEQTFGVEVRRTRDIWYFYPRNRLGGKVRAERGQSYMTLFYERLSKIR